VCLAVNRLNSQGLRDICHSKDDLTWKSLITLLRRVTEQESEMPLLREPIFKQLLKIKLWYQKATAQGNNNRKPSKASEVDNWVVMLTFDYFKKGWKEDMLIKKCYRFRSSSHLDATCPQTQCWRCFKHGRQCMIKTPQSTRLFNTSARNRSLSLHRRIKECKREYRAKGDDESVLLLDISIRATISWSYLR